MGMQSVSIIGIGRVGGALAIALSNAGYEIEYLVHRNAATADAIRPQAPQSIRFASSDSFPQIGSDVIFITTADPDIRDTGKRLADYIRGRPVVLHTSGSLSSDVLANLAEIGCPVGSMHPLVSISDAASGSTNFSNAFFCIEGDSAAVTCADSIARSLGGRPFSIDSRYKPLYHAAAVTACGHLVALVDVAIEMLSKCGLDPATAKEVLLPLIESTIDNLETQKPERALTGSFARADLSAVERHLASIDNTMSPLVREIYLLLGERSLDLAVANGAKPGDVEKLRDRISIAKRKPE